MDIRLGNADDVQAIVDIYNHYVLHSWATFDENPVTVEERQGWLAAFAATGPYRIVVAADPGVVGYACSVPYASHASFSQTVEFSVRVAPERTRQGLGTKLYRRLFRELTAEHLHRAVVGIALPNEASVRLHRRFGFQDIGVFDEYAMKWGRYVSSVWMQRSL